VQLEETERTFDDFWQSHFIKLNQCLELRQFEQDFRELRAGFDEHLIAINKMTEIGDSVERIDQLIKEAALFQQKSVVSSTSAPSPCVFFIKNFWYRPTWRGQTSCKASELN
jgi:hypothetical protein